MDSTALLESSLIFDYLYVTFHELWTHDPCHLPYTLTALLKLASAGATLYQMSSYFSNCSNR